MAIIIDLFSRRILAVNPDPCETALKPYFEIKSRIEVRFGDTLPKHFARCLAKPQKQPYMHGDTHNVTYKASKRLFNKPMPIPCEVTTESCVKAKGRYLLGSKCLAGIDEAFPWMDRKYQVTLNFLRSLPNGTKLTVMTRSDLVGCEEYVNEFKRLDCIVMILIPKNASEESLRTLEPGAPSAKRRIEANQVLVENGIQSQVCYHDVPMRKAG